MSNNCAECFWEIDVSIYAECVWENDLACYFKTLLMLCYVTFIYLDSTIYVLTNLFYAVIVKKPQNCDEAK